MRELSQKGEKILPAAVTCNWMFKTRRSLSSISFTPAEVKKCGVSVSPKELARISSYGRLRIVAFKRQLARVQSMPRVCRQLPDREEAGSVQKSSSSKNEYTLKTPIAALREKFEANPNSSHSYTSSFTSSNCSTPRTSYMKETIPLNTDVDIRRRRRRRINKTQNEDLRNEPRISQQKSNMAYDSTATEVDGTKRTIEDSNQIERGALNSELSATLNHSNQSKMHGNKTKAQLSQVCDQGNDRGVLMKDTGSSYHHSVMQRPQYQRKDSSPPPPDQRYYGNEEDQRHLRMQHYEYEQMETRNDDVFATSSYMALEHRHDLTKSSSSLNNDPAMDLRSSRISADYSSTGSLDRPTNVIVQNQIRPAVKLRARKARDKGYSVERPRSWHASKHPDLDPALSQGEKNMRSPVAAYSANLSSTNRFHEPPLSKPRPRSKGWYESGDLKTPYRGDNGSRDSLISGESHHSYRSGRLSVSSSRSSGTMSSSRGSLDNLLESNYSNRLSGEISSHPQIIINSQRKPSSPCKPQSGIVSQQKNMFERLSQESAANQDANPQFYRKGSREDLDIISRVVRPDDSDKDMRGQGRTHYGRDNTKNSVDSGRNSRRSSFSPPPVGVHLHNRSLESESHKNEDASSRKLDSNRGNRISSPEGCVSKRSIGADVRHANTKIINSNQDTDRVSSSVPANLKSQDCVPEPPTRDRSSAQAVKNYNLHSPPEKIQERRHMNNRRSSSPGEKPRDMPSRNSAPQPNKATPHAPNPRETSSVSGRMFGVMSVGNGKNIVTTSVTVPSRISDQDRSREANFRSKKLENKNSTTSPPRYELLSDSYTRAAVKVGNDESDYVSRKMNRQKKTDHDYLEVSSAIKSPADHSRSVSEELNDNLDPGKRNYGAVWKTPQTHRRGRSDDFSSVLSNRSSREDIDEPQSKLSIFQAKDNYVPQSSVNVGKHAGDFFPSPVKRNSADIPNAAGSIANKKADSHIDNSPSILRSLQNAQSMEHQYKDPQVKAVTENYETLWFPETKNTSGGENTQILEKKDTVSDVLPSQQNNYREPKKYTRSWTTDFKEVDLDDPNDDEFGAHEDDYCNDIKDMSSKVLRVTSFTRKELDISPSYQNFDQKRRQFQYPSRSSLKQVHPAITHSRSRSHGNEIDEDSNPVSPLSKLHDEAAPRRTRPRPKSAGVTRPSRHAPIHHSTAIPHKLTPSYSTKHASLPRSRVPSYHSDDPSSPASKVLNQEHASQNRRVSVDVKPDAIQQLTPKSDFSDHEKRKAVLSYFSRKAGRSFDDSSGDIRNENSKLSNKHSTPTSHRPEHMTSVRKLKNFKETREKFNQGFNRLTSRTKSTSSLLEEDESVTYSRGRRALIKPGDRSASLENLADSGIDFSRGSPRQSRQRDLKEIPHTDRTKSSHMIDPLSPSNASSPPLETNVVIPPKKLPRKRYSNSSNVSVATTVSSVSSSSSSSSASAGKFPTVDEEGDRVNADVSPPHHETSQPTSSNVETWTGEKTGKFARRTPIDTGTYRVAKGQKRPGRPVPVTRSSLENNDTSENTALLRSVVEIKVNTPHSKLVGSKSNMEEAEDEVDNKHSAPTTRMSPTLGETKSTVDLSASEKVQLESINNKRSNSPFKSSIVPMVSKALPPPPPPMSPPADDATAQLLDKLVQNRTENELPLPPEIPHKPTSAIVSTVSCSTTKETSPTQSMTTVSSLHNLHDNDAETEQKSSKYNAHPPTIDDVNKKVTMDTASALDSKLTSIPSNRTSALPSYENVHLNGNAHPYENVFTPIKESLDTVPTGAKHEVANEVMKEAIGNIVPHFTTEETNSKPEESKVSNAPINDPPLEASPRPLLPDVSMLTVVSSLQTNSDLTKDLAQGDKVLAQVLSTSNQKTSDDGVLSQPSHDIIEEGRRYRRSKPSPSDPPTYPEPTQRKIPVPSEGLLNIAIESHLYLQRFRNDLLNHGNLPASSTYYKTSASKAKILHMMQEKIADGEISDEELENGEEIIKRKVELILSIHSKLNEFQQIKGLLDVETRENELLGKQVHELIKDLCKQREQEKYTLFVQDVDKIINLLLSLSGRLTRAENAIQMLSPDADKQEMEQLVEKRKKLAEQYNEAKQLKADIDKRQMAVSESLAGYFDQEQFADYEHYIIMKSGLIDQQRKLDDKVKLGKEQVQCLRESLPDEWQANLDKMIDEE